MWELRDDDDMPPRELEDEVFLRVCGALRVFMRLCVEMDKDCDGRRDSYIALLVPFR